MYMHKNILVIISMNRFIKLLVYNVFIIMHTYVLLQ